MSDIKRYAGILVKKHNEVLLCKRNALGQLPGIWSIPAGKIIHGENVLVAAKREFFEETNLTINGNLSLCGFINRTNRDGKKIKGLLYVLLYEVNEKIYPDLENAEDGDEHTECGYFNIENLPEHDKNDQLMKIIKNILSKN